MAFPSSIPSYAGFTATHTLAVDQHGEQHNQEQADIVGIATKIGTGSSTPTSGVALVGNGVGTSIWGQIPLTTGVSGILPVNSGGTGTGTSTGTGSVVLNTAPTTNNQTATNLTSTKLNNSGGITNTGGVTTDTIATTGNATVGGTLGVTGVATFTANPVLPNASIPGNELVGINMFGVGAASYGTPPARLTGQFYIQAGEQVVTVASSTVGTITFPTPFPNGLLFSVVWPADNSVGGYCMGYKAGDTDAQTQFVYPAAASDVVTMKYLAIGF